MINPLYRIAGNLLSPGGSKARLSILIYHRILPQPDEIFPNEIDSKAFETHMKILKKVFNVIPLGEAIPRLHSATLPSRAACISFDDGYADNVSLALPILQRHRLHATFFIATAYVNGGRMFNDTVIHAIRHSRDLRIDLSKLGLGHYDLSKPEAKRQAIGTILSHVKYLPLGQREDTVEELCAMVSDAPPPNDLMMTTQQIKELSNAGMDIGGHTMRHPILARLSAQDANREIAEGKEYLESLLKTRINLFAYPNGKPGLDYLPEHVDIVRKLGFKAAVSTYWGTANQDTDLFQLPRFTPYGTSKHGFTPLLLQNLMRRNN